MVPRGELLQRARRRDRAEDPRAGDGRSRGRDVHGALGACTRVRHLDRGDGGRAGECGLRRARGRQRTDGAGGPRGDLGGVAGCRECVHRGADAPAGAVDRAACRRVDAGDVRRGRDRARADADAMSAVIWPEDGASLELLGGKAGALAKLRRFGLPIPAWFVVSPEAAARGGWEEELATALRRLAPNGEPVAVRSSAAGEDGVDHSYAGQLESYLFVRSDEVVARVREVWESAASARVAAYRVERKIAGASVPAVLVQRMVDAEKSGVAFSADPVSGRRGRCIVAASFGLGTALVSGADDADTIVVERAGEIVERTTAMKRVAHRRGPDGGIVEQPLGAEDSARPVLSDSEARA